MQGTESRVLVPRGRAVARRSSPYAGSCGAGPSADLRGTKRPENESSAIVSHGPIRSHGGSLVRFDKLGTFRYTVHLSGAKAHAHTGTVVVK